MSRKDTLMGVLSIALFLCFQVPFAEAAAENITIPVNVGVVLDADTEIGKMGMKCISMALSDLYASHGSSYRTRLVLNTRDSKNTVVGAAAAGSILSIPWFECVLSCFPLVLSSDAKGSGSIVFVSWTLCVYVFFSRVHLIKLKFENWNLKSELRSLNSLSY